LSRPIFSPTPNPDRFTQRLVELRASLKNSNPAQLAARSGAAFEASEAGNGRFHLPLWGRQVLLDWPAMTAAPAEDSQPVNDMELTLLLFYLSMADGTVPAGQWISFSELPDGRFYDQAFQGYTGHSLAGAFQNDLPAFSRAAVTSNGVAYPAGDAAFAFQVLPHLPLLAVYWQGDEDFPASAKILFDATAPHYLPTEACAILGSTLTRRLLKARQTLT
jgi:hypothetical protein